MPPASELRMRRNEVNRCREVLGWSWATLGLRLELTPAMAHAIDKCRREVTDADMEWLQQLAQAVTLLPRPRDQRRGAGRLAGWNEARQAPTAEQEAADMALRDEVIGQVVELYATSDEIGEAGEGGPGARHALGELMRRLGWLDETRARLQARAAAEEAVRQAQAVPETLGTLDSVDDAGGGEEAAGDAVEAAAETSDGEDESEAEPPAPRRVPFAATEPAAG